MKMTFHFGARPIVQGERFPNAPDEFATSPLQKMVGNGRLDPAAFFEMDDFQGLFYVVFREGMSSF